jgi:hypothetical protein
LYDNNNSLIGGIGFIEDRKGPFRRAYTPIVSAWGGFLAGRSESNRTSMQEKHRHKIYEELLAYSMKTYDIVSLSHGHDMFDMRPFIRHGWDVDVRYTYRIPLEGLDTENGVDNAFRSFDSNIRKNLKKAQSALAIGEPVSAGDFMSLYAEVFKEKGMAPPLRVNSLERFIAELNRTEYAEIITVREKSTDEHAVNSFFVVHAAGEAYILYVVADPEYYRLNGATLLYWEAMQHYAESCDTLDLVGANIPSVAQFKRSFEGVLTPYFMTEWYRAPYIMKTCIGIYRSVRAIIPW